jgi:hypothetical protein
MLLEGHPRHSHRGLLGVDPLREVIHRDVGRTHGLVGALRPDDCRTTTPAAKGHQECDNSDIQRDTSMNAA